MTAAPLRSNSLTRFFHPVLESSGLGKKPVKVLLGGSPYVLFRDPAGKPAALVNRCAHRHTPLSGGKMNGEGRLQCAYHGWSFGADGVGKAPGQPKLNCAIESLQAIERFGFVWIADRATPLSEFPSFEPGAGYEFAGSFMRELQAPVHVALANFTENSHAPYIHRLFGPDAAGLETAQIAVDTHPDHTDVRQSYTQRHVPSYRIMGVRKGDVFRNRYVTRFNPVHTVYDQHWEDPVTSAPRRMFQRHVWLTVPLDEQRCQTFFIAFIRDTGVRPGAATWLTRKLVTRGVKSVTAEDKWIIELTAGTSKTLAGMRLDKQDVPVVHNLRLLQSLYFGTAEK